LHFCRSSPPPHSHPSPPHIAPCYQVTSLITLPQVGATSDFLCYDFGSNKYEELSKYFPTVTLHFEGADMTVEPPGYVFLHSNTLCCATTLWSMIQTT
ncbi:unnamed protein product, partial [Closterium sp. NIES-54]